MSKDLIIRLSHSSEQSIRDKAVEELHELIKSKKLSYEDVELKKLFQGIFYCFYHSDKTQYQNELADKFTSFLNDIDTEDHKLTWHRYFFKMLSMHWDKIDNWRINKFLALVRKQIVIVFQHIKSIWESKNEYLKLYMDAMYEEALKEIDVPMGIGLQMADVYIEEMVRNFSKDELIHERVVELLSPFLKALGKIHQIALFQRIKEKVFDKLIECNGVKSDDANELYLPKFDIVQYAESQIYELASSNDIIESRREDIYVIYEKAAGREKPKEPELSYVEKLKHMQMSVRSPQTKHQKKKMLRDKAKRSMQIKKRILKMIQEKQLQLLPTLGNSFNVPDEDDPNDNPQTASIETITKEAINLINGKSNGNQEVMEEQPKQDLIEDQIIEIDQSQHKKKKQKKVKVSGEKTVRSGKKVVFNLDQNKTKEFYMHSKVSMIEFPKSKE